LLVGIGGCMDYTIHPYTIGLVGGYRGAYGLYYALIHYRFVGGYRGVYGLYYTPIHSIGLVGGYSGGVWTILYTHTLWGCWWV
jgi:hypothetical protein